MRKQSTHPSSHHAAVTELGERNSAGRKSSPFPLLMVMELLSPLLSQPEPANRGAGLVPPVLRGQEVLLDAHPQSLQLGRCVLRGVWEVQDYVPLYQACLYCPEPAVYPWAFPRTECCSAALGCTPRPDINPLIFLCVSLYHRNTTNIYLLNEAFLDLLTIFLM